MLQLIEFEEVTDDDEFESSFDEEENKEDISDCLTKESTSQEDQMPQ